jgi:hypothetical protein
MLDLGSGVVWLAGEWIWLTTETVVAFNVRVVDVLDCVATGLR